MPTINKPMVMPSGDSMELLETSAMTNGRQVKARFVFAATGVHVATHLHPDQDETYEVISGNLTYFLDGTKHVASAGSTVRLPHGVPHKHFSEGPGDTIVIQTMTPAGDFDYVVETLFGLGSEDRLRGLNYALQGMVMIRRMKSPVVLAGVPQWLQRGVAWVFTPIAELFGYRAVYQRFSGEEW